MSMRSSVIGTHLPARQIAWVPLPCWPAVHVSHTRLSPRPHSRMLTLVQVPYILAQTTVFVPIAYWMIRFRGTASAFFFFYLVFFMCADSALPLRLPGTSRATTYQRVSRMPRHGLLFSFRPECLSSDGDLLRLLPCAGRVLTLFTFFGQFLVYVSPSIQMAQIMASGAPSCSEVLVECKCSFLLFPAAAHHVEGTSLAHKVFGPWQLAQA